MQPSTSNTSIAQSASSSRSSYSMTQRHWPPRLYLAIDCGGTKAAACICDERGQLVGRGQGGPANYIDIGLTPFLNSVESAVKSALDGVRAYFAQGETDYDWQRPSTPISEDGEEGGKATESIMTIADALSSVKPSFLPSDAPSPQFEAAWLGIAGVDSPADVTSLSPHLATLLSIPYPSQRLIVANDTSLLASPIADPKRPEIKSGVVAIAGTGSIVMSFRRKRNGMLRVLGRVGGFGWLLGDEGSGYSVGRAAVRQVLDLADRERLALRKRSTLCAERKKKDSFSLFDDDEVGEEEDNSADEIDSECDGESEDERIGVSMRNSQTSASDGPETFEMDMTSRTSREDFADIDRKTTSEDVMPQSPPPSARSATYPDTCLAKAQPYGHLLRDRILQHWSLLSTDELLRAVYFGDLPAQVDRHRGTPPELAVNASCSDVNDLSRSDNTLNADPSSDSHRALSPGTTTTIAPSAPPHSKGRTAVPLRVSLAVPADAASASLLPPTAPMLDVETRLRNPSPIPSLSSSPSVSSAASFSEASSVAGGKAYAVRGNGSQATLSSDGRTQSDSVTSASSSFSTTAVAGAAGAASKDSLCRNGVGGRGVSVGINGNGNGKSNGKSNASCTLSAKQARGATTERKHRLASLAPLVFHLAFTHDDEMSMEILRLQARFMALQVCEIVRPTRQAKAHLVPAQSVLCLGGSLVGVQRYRDLLVEQLCSLGVTFARIEFVGDPARHGATALAHITERALTKQQQPSC